MFCSNTNIYHIELREKAESNPELETIFSSIEKNQMLTHQQKEQLSMKALLQKEITPQFDLSDGECLISSKRC